MVDIGGSEDKYPRNLSTCLFACCADKYCQKSRFCVFFSRAESKLTCQPHKTSRTPPKDKFTYHKVHYCHIFKNLKSIDNLVHWIGIVCLVLNTELGNLLYLIGSPPLSNQLIVQYTRSHMCLHIFKDNIYTDGCNNVVL